MRRLIAIVLIFAVLWFGYWFIARAALERGVADAFHNARAEGRVARYQSLGVTGFPNRFDMTLDKVALGLPLDASASASASTQAQAVWHAPQVQLIALSYRPNRMIAVLPGAQMLTLPDQKITLTSKQLAANFNLAADTALSFDSLALIGDKLDITSTDGWAATLKQGRLAANRLPAPATYRVGFEALDLTPNPALRARLDPNRDLPAVIDKLHLDGRLTLSAPLDRHVGESRPQPQAITLTDARLDWGQTRIVATGTLRRGAGGLAEGQLDVKIIQWQPLLRIAEADGVIEPARLATWRKALQALAQGSGRADTIDLPLVFGGGQISLGFLPLGPAPRF
ncbi:hypothetical protein U879_04495 [Defluviimonas sp. 20V17]|uniref:DUF2125 domain-containing protein n=1 Tax=Allgaiera indica TaxID=765699 RepID=A0AAN4ZYZ0_9RHOB|nr:DUF2125 domain-containing protein [Allgaiera indica]KDB04875.1 hypothetical protein U879_04495 [Defluviimonas sp. 20V17]GHD99066.1 hypothetical protein GCM10008024_05100 [Allgaiera indica]SDW01041.1 hypothetical protein SAMN05444006_10138 [Allgaiera indica]